MADGNTSQFIRFRFRGRGRDTFLDGDKGTCPERSGPSERVSVLENYRVTISLGLSDLNINEDVIGQ